MNFADFMARRYISTSRENRFFSWITLLSTLGIATGVAAMIVVMGIFNGFEHELRDRFLAANAHIMAFHFPGGMERPEKWAERFKQDFPQDIVAMSPFTYNETMARKTSIMHSILVRGIDADRREKVQSLRGLVRPPESINILTQELQDLKDKKPVPEAPAIILGVGLASLLDAKVGDTIRVVAPDSDKMGELFPFKVVGVYDSGLTQYDNKLGWVNISAAQRLFRLGEKVTGIEIGLKDPKKSKTVADKMEELYTISIREWQSFNASTFNAMDMERAVTGCITALVALVASFNILTTLFISVTQKQKSISVLKSLGTTNRQIRRIFFLQGAYIGIIGSVLGLALAFCLSQLLERYQFIDLPEMYLVAKLPVSYDPKVYASVALGGILLCLVAGMIPAYVASRVVPTDGFKGNAGMK